MSQTKLKLVTLGEISSGKTSIIRRLLEDIFVISESTIGASFFTYNHNDIRYEIWDTAGSERFMALAPIYFRNADIILLVFDLSSINLASENYSGFEKVEFYIKKLQEDMYMREFKIIIIGTKSDLVTSHELENIKIAAHLRFSGTNDNFAYISSKNGYGFDDFKEQMFMCGSQMKQLKHPSDDIIFLDPKQSTRFPNCLC
jgi:small GTP-binding protein